MIELSTEGSENLASDLCNYCIVGCAGATARAAAAVVLALAVCSAVVGAGLASGVLSGETHLLTELHKSLELVAGDLLDVSVLTNTDLASVKVDLCIELNLFHCEACSDKRVTNCESAVVLQKD